MNDQALYLATTREEYAIRRGSPGERPVPPPELMEYGESADTHLTSGEREVASMLSLLEQSEFSWQRCRRVLDFGCNNGRLIRWLDPFVEDREIWGVDVQADKVLWAMEHLSPPFRFAVTTTIPHLPFPDRHFDLIYAGSIFTHLGELHVAWLAELARVLAPGGLLYVTIHDETSIQVLLEEPGRDRIRERIDNSEFAEELKNGDFDFVSMAPYGNAMLSLVMISESHINHIARPLELIGRFPRAYAGFQTGYVFAQPERDSLHGS